MFHGAAHQIDHKGVAFRPLFGVQSIIVFVDRLVDGTMPCVPGKQDLQRALPGFAAGRHYVACRKVRSRFAISIAVMAASKPLFPPLAPARSMACSSVFLVRTPKAPGKPASLAACAIPLAASPA